MLIVAVHRAGEGDFDGSAAVAERCCGLLAGDANIDAHFERAPELHGSAWPFARARTELCYAERLRRAGQRVDARVQLRAALETFERLGARPWAERAASELRATGERIARRAPTAAEQLTPQELQIALTVARGATNREAGAALLLSPKTIEAHLGRVYRSSACARAPNSRTRCATRSLPLERNPMRAGSGQPSRSPAARRPRSIRGDLP